MYRWEDLPSENQPTRSKGVSKTFTFAVLALGILLGFTLGLFYFNSTDSRRASEGLYDEDLVTSLFETASPAVVEINVTRSVGSIRLPGTGTGSGFLIDGEGHIVTNNHVLSQASEFTVNLADGRTLEAIKLGTSPADDLALLQVDPGEVTDIDPLPLADSGDVNPGQMAVAIGSPFRQFNSITVGVVSGTGRGSTSVLQRPIPDMIQTDAPLNSGNSGGPLLNSDGEVIGVNSSVRTDGIADLKQYRIGFAVPSNTIRDLLPQLLKPQQVRRPWLGISGGPVTRELIESGGLPEGVFVDRVFPRSPAAEAGLVPFLSANGTGRGDVITAVDGLPVASVEEMVRYFNTLDPGDPVTLSIFRNSRTFKVAVTLVEWPDT